MIKYTVLLVALFVSLRSSAQHNFNEGFIVTDKNDTVRGFIDYKEWDRSPASFNYAVDKYGSSSKVYKASEVKFLEVSGMDYFETHQVSISQGKVAPLERLNKTADTEIKNDIVLLRLLSRGNTMNLYSFKDDIKTRYYVKESGTDTLIELIYKRYLSTSNDGKIVTDESYKHQLIEIANRKHITNATELIKMLNKTEYKLKDLMRIQRYINAVSFVSLLPKSKDAAQFYLGLGIGASTAKYSGGRELSSDANSKLSVLPTASVGVNFYINPNVRKTIVRLDLTFLPSKQKITKVTGIDNGYVKHEFGRYSIVLSPQIIVNLYNKEYFKFNIGVGVSGSYSINTNSIYEAKYTAHSGIGGKFDYSEKIDLQHLGLTIPIRTGILLGNKLDIYAQFNLPAISISAYHFYEIQIMSGQLGINFLF